MIKGGPTISSNGLVLYLDAGNTDSYNSGSSTWYDLCDTSNGTLTNGPTFNGANGGSIIFDGINDYITLGNNKYQYQDNFTLEAWCNFTNLPNNAGLCGARHPIVYNHDYGYNMTVGSAGLLRFDTYNTVSTNAGANSLTSVVGQNYFHGVGTKNGTTISLYLNGIFQNLGTLTTNAVYYINEPFVIGGNALCGGSRFYSTGNIAIVKVYNRALTSSEILNNYNMMKGRFGLT